MKPFLTRLLFLMILISSVVLPQQVKTIFNDNKPSEFIPEIKGVAVFENGKVSIGFTFPTDSRKKEYQNVDLQKDDEIQFVNGKRIKTIEDFKKYFGNAEVGKEIKLGIKRNSERFIVAFIKAKQEMEGQKMIRMDGGGKGDFKMKDGKIMMDGKMVNIDSLKKAGKNVIIRSEEKK